VPADGLAEGVARLLGHLLLEVLDWLVGVAAYWIGFATLRVASWGRYPGAQPTGREQRVCQVVGVAIVLALAVALIGWLSY
jgi:hypothetical protein